MRNICKTLSAALFAAATALSAAADGVWLEKSHNFGAFDEDMGVVTCRFHLVNNGTEPMVILGARANCGCTRPTFTREPIAPGDTATVTVGFDPKGRPGKFTKHIYVDTDAKPSRTTLEISGTVIGASNTLKSRYPVDAGPMKLRGVSVAYGRIIKDHAAGKALEGYNASSDTLRPVIKGNPRHINVIVEPAVVPPGEQFVISTVFHSDMCPDWGISTGSFTVTPSPGAEPVSIETVAIINEDFSGLTSEQMNNAPVVTLSESKLDLGTVTRADKPVRLQFNVTNSGKDPLLIRQISCTDPAVAVECKDRKVKKGKSAKVIVTVDPSKIKGEILNARITLTVNDPLHPSDFVRVVGLIK